MPIDNTATIRAKRIKQKRIFNTLKNLAQLPKVEVYAANSVSENDPDGLDALFISHPQVYVPNFEFRWSHDKEYYRVYIHLATSVTDKSNAGYCICTIGTGLAAVGFGALYTFLHKHRANNKEAA